MPSVDRVAALSPGPVENGLPPRPGSSESHPMNQLDGCPEACGNTETPRDIEPTCEGYRATYLCSDCGVEWYTSWGA